MLLHREASLLAELKQQHQSKCDAANGQLAGVRVHLGALESAISRAQCVLASSKADAVASSSASISSSPASHANSTVDSNVGGHLSVQDVQAILAHCELKNKVAAARRQIPAEACELDDADEELDDADGADLEENDAEENVAKKRVDLGSADGAVNSMLLFTIDEESKLMTLLQRAGSIRTSDDAVHQVQCTILYINCEAGRAAV